MNKDCHEKRNVMKKGMSEKRECQEKVISEKSIEPLAKSFIVACVLKLWVIFRRWKRYML